MNANIDSVALGHAFIIPSESQRVIENYTKLSLDQLGSSEWAKQQEVMEKLNLQAHYCAQHNTDNFVVEDFVTFDKCTTIIHNLLIAEAWNDLIFPHLSEATVNHHAMRIYFIMYQEATLCNFLEVALYHEHVIEQCDETLMEIVDYCVRRIRWLVSSPRSHATRMILNHSKSSVAEMSNHSRRTDLTRQLDDIRFQSSVSAISLLRYIAEHISVVPLAVVTRMLDTHDVLLTILPLMENPPWTFRHPESGQWKKFVDAKWTDVALEDLMLLTKTEAQLWFILFHLCCSQVCREKYSFNTFRKTQLLRVRKYLNEVLVDQVPVLADVQRYMDELAIMDVSQAGVGGFNNSCLILETVPVMRESILRERVTAQDIERRIFNILTPEEQKNDLERLVGIYHMEGIEELLGETSTSAPRSRMSEPTSIRVCISTPFDDDSQKRTSNVMEMQQELTLTRQEDVPAQDVGDYIRYAFQVLSSPNKEAQVLSSGSYVAEVEFQSKETLALDAQWLDLPTLTTPSTKKLWKQLGTKQNPEHVGILQFQCIPSEAEAASPTREGPFFYLCGKVFLSLPVDKH